MDSKETPSSGSSPIKISSFSDSGTENVTKTNALNTDDVVKFSNKDTSSSDSISSIASSDDVGFLSGEEEFETTSVVAETLEKGIIEEGAVDDSGGSSEFPMPIDDVEKDKVLNGADEEPSVVVEGLGSSSNLRNGSSDSKEVIGGEGFEGKPDNLNLNPNSSGGDKVAEFSEMNEEVRESKLKDEVVEEDKKIEVLNGENSAAASESREVRDVVEESAIGTANPEIVELTDSELVEADGVKFNSEGESIVEVDLPAPGVAVVGQVEETEEADGNTDSKLVDTGSSKSTSEGESIVQATQVDFPTPAVAVVGQVEEKEEADENTDSKLGDADSLKSTPEGESNVEAMHVDLAAPGVAVVGQVEGNEEADRNEDSKLVEEDAAQFTPEGESTVEAIHVDWPAPGAAIVGQIEENEEADGNKDSKLVEEDSAKFTPEVESIVEAIHVDLPAPGVAQIEETKEVEGNTALNNGSDQTNEEVDVNTTLSNGSDQTSHGAAADFEKKSEPPTNKNVETTKQEPIEPKIAGDELGNLADANGSVQSGVVEVVSAEEPSSILNRQVTLEAEDIAGNDTDEEGGSGFDDDDTEGLIFGSSEASKQFIEELEHGSGGDSHSGAGSSLGHSQRIDGQIATDSDEEVDTDEEGDGKELFDSAALAALLKAATGGGSENGNITLTSQDGSRLFTVERPAGLGSSLQSLKPASRPNRSGLFTTPGITSGGESDNNLSEEDKKKLEKLQSIRVKFLRLVHRLGLSVEESVAAQVLYRLALVAGRQTGQLFSLDAAKRTAMELEAEGKEDLDFAVNILVLGKSGVGKSATINSIFGEEKALINAFEPATTTVKEISGVVDGVKIRVFDTPGLRSSAMEQAFNRSVLSSVKKFTKKCPPDIVFYVDRLDAQTRDLNDLPLLRMITSSLGPSIWRSAIVTLTHAASAPPDGPSGSPLSYDMFVTQRSHVVQQSIGQAVGDLRMMSPSLMNPVTLVENHPSCRKNREGQKVLPNGQSWRPQLLLLSYSMKILAEANSVSKPQDPFDHRRLFGFRVRSPPLPYMLSSMLQSRAHPKLSSEQGGEDSDVDLADFSDSDKEEDEDEYDQLPPFKPLKKGQLAKLSNEQKKAYFEEYDYRVKLLQKKQWKEELKRMREMKKRGKDSVMDAAFMEEDGDPGAAAPVSVPLPDMVLPPSFDGDNASHRYRFLEPTSQFLARPVLDTHGWDHDCGYDGVNVEQSLAIASRFPAVIAVQVTKDKKEFNFNLDSSVAAKHGENGSTMAGFDIQPIGKQLAYIVRGETKFKILKKNKTAAGVTVTFLGENVATGFKVEDQIVLGKQYVLVGSAGTVRSQQDAAYGANIEVQRRELDYPIGQVQSTFGLSIIKWRGDLALGFNSLTQFSVGRGSKVAVRAGINNKLSGQITVKTSSSEHLSLALAGFVPTALAIYKKIWPGVNEKYSIH